MPAVPRSRRDRPAKPLLSLDAVVDAAATVLAREGFERLTLRRIAAELDTGAASLYVYIRSNAELHVLLLDRTLADLDVTWNGRNDWRRRLHRLLVEYVDVLMTQPGLARSAVVTWPRGEHYFDLIDLILRLLTAGGLPDARAAWAVDILLQQATAMGAEYGSRQEAGANQTFEALQEAVSDPARPRPDLERIGVAALLSGPPVDRRDWAIDALITGVSETPRPQESP